MLKELIKGQCTGAELLEGRQSERGKWATGPYGLVRVWLLLGVLWEPPQTLEHKSERT